MVAVHQQPLRQVWHLRWIIHIIGGRVESVEVSAQSDRVFARNSEVKSQTRKNCVGVEINVEYKCFAVLSTSTRSPMPDIFIS